MFLSFYKEAQVKGADITKVFLQELSCLMHQTITLWHFVFFFWREYGILFECKRNRNNK